MTPLPSRRDYQERLVDRLDALRALHGMSKSAFARAIETERRTVQRWGTGGAVPSLYQLEIARAFNMSLSEMLAYPVPVGGGDYLVERRGGI